MKKICVVAGARPNFVKVAPLIRLFAKTDDVQCHLVYTGREDDPTIEPTLFQDLQISRPDFFLGVDSVSLNEITSRVMAEFDKYLDAHPVDVVLVVDDLASTMAAAIVSKKRGVKLAHLVAGTRSFDIAMPKEINRLVIDALSDFLFTAGMKSNSVATREQGEASQTYMVGNILMDNLRFNRDRLRRPQLPVEDGSYIVFTLNRKALISDGKVLSDIVTTIEETAGCMTVVAPLRSDARKAVLKTDAGKTFLLADSLPYLEFEWLTAHAKGIITDSGNVAEEATFNGVPCITINNYTEHQETVTVGSNVLVGGDMAKLREEMQRMITGQWKKIGLPDRWDGRTSERILQILRSF